jgi:FG-GAP-like repeat/FG-GAP repeat
MWKHVAPFVLLAACGGSDNTPVSDGSADAAGDVTAPDTSVVDTPSPDDVTAPDVTVTDATAPDVTVTDATVTDATVTDVPVADVQPPVDVTPPVDTSPIALCSRPLLPLSTTRVTSQRPTLQFARAPGLRTTLVEVCRTRECSSPTVSVDTPDDYVALTANLAPGLYYWRITPRNADGATCVGPTWQFTVPARSLTPSRTWGANLDLNGDGFADLAVATLAASGATGTVRVFYGTATGFEAAASTELTGLVTQSGSYTAAPVPVPAGDLNGDGFADLAVGLPAALNGDGQVLVYLGSPRGISTRPDADLRSTEGHNGRFGASLAGVGDIEGDGYGDLAIGAPRAAAASATDTSVAGRVYTFHGLPNGIRYTPTTTITGPAGPRGEFGAAVAGAGDVNSDRFPDLVVGAPGAGRAYVFRGTALGLIATPIATFDDAATANFGAMVGSAGDVDADDHADVFVAGGGSDGRVVVRPAGSNGMFMGAPVVLRGSGPVGAVAATDFNADGYSDVVFGVPSANSALLHAGSATGLSTTAVTLASPLAGFGASIVSVGDVQRDGPSDFVVGSSAGAAVYTGVAMGSPTARMLTVTDRVANLGGAWGGL